MTSDDYVAIDVNLGKGSPTPLAFAELKAEMVALHTEMFGAAYVEKLRYAESHGFGATLVPEPLWLEEDEALTFCAENIFIGDFDIFKGNLCGIRGALTHFVELLADAQSRRFTIYNEA